MWHFPFDKCKIPEYAFIAENTANAALADENTPEENIGEATAHVPVINDHDRDNRHSPNTVDPDQNPFEAISAVPYIPGPSGYQKRKQHAEVLTSPEVVAAKQEKKESKEKNICETDESPTTNEKKTDDKQKSNTKENAENNKQLVKGKSRRSAPFDYSESETEV
ncbi:unnamed protein product [Acanthoscelides obtectus]|uniref:Uncharacterized protein n=1 Tax=Acanthoscelides obtectus TaxID=200917 RepID=A0A9P0K135_ACAOB|nr:unnamed protein product [Acanthoscelides obtectus]CAK1623794.1 hypothetical protein AOBTE_LOCUS2188 [Acanthoscelides obtectus]